MIDRTGRRRHANAIAVLLVIVSFALPSGAEDVYTAPRVDVVATGLEAPWALAFDRTGALYVTERPGRLRVIRNRRLVPAPLATLGVSATGEGGLLGLALDAAFEKNGFLYVYYTTRKGARLINRVSRLTVQDDHAAAERVLLDDIPGGDVRNGGRLTLGPDRMLYAATGDASTPDLAQDRESLAGKILRVAPDGSIPKDNPFPGSPVYAMGFRNPQGLAWDGDRLLVSELVTGPHDEINEIVRGGNYGWPVVSGLTADPRFRPPLIESAGAVWKPSGIAVHRESLYVAALLGRQLVHIRLRPEPVTPLSSVLDETWGRLRDVVLGPDQALYVATSNRDGRGTAHADDDRILRVVP